ncbi:hypothetical protein AB1K91_05365 [Terribacillus sp. 179-K 1B1 HS]|uniref:hypothetical protein n=1 Tax=Terribacillus sp. 179-K 1B1 HS TaxID=3142388 RepID=UPI0039A3A6FA
MKKEISRIKYGDTEMTFRSATFYLGKHNGRPCYILRVSDARNKPDVFTVDEVIVTTKTGEKAVMQISISDLNTKDTVEYLVAGEPTFS